MGGMATRRTLPCPGPDGAAAACLHQEHGGEDEGQVKEEGDQI